MGEGTTSPRPLPKRQAASENEHVWCVGDPPAPGALAATAVRFRCMYGTVLWCCVQYYTVYTGLYCRLVGWLVGRLAGWLVWLTVCTVLSSPVFTVQYRTSVLWYYGTYIQHSTDERVG